MVDRAADVATVRRPDHDGRTEVAVGAPAHRRQLVAQLHVRRPDVVEELDLDDRLEAAQRETDRAADDVGFGEWRVVDALVAELLLQPPGDFEDATLALHLA